MTTTLLLPFIPSPMGTQAPRLPEAAEVEVLAGRGWAELLVSAIRHGLLVLFSLLMSSSAALGSGMGWLMPSSSSWACCLLRATWKHRAASHPPAKHTPLPTCANPTAVLHISEEGRCSSHFGLPQSPDSLGVLAGFMSI